MLGGADGAVAADEEWRIGSPNDRACRPLGDDGYGWYYREHEALIAAERCPRPRLFAFMPAEPAA